MHITFRNEERKSRGRKRKRIMDIGNKLKRGRLGNAEQRKQQEKPCVWGGGRSWGLGAQGTQLPLSQRVAPCILGSVSAESKPGSWEKPGPRAPLPLERRVLRGLWGTGRTQCPSHDALRSFWSLSTLLGGQTLLFCPDPGRGPIGLRITATLHRLSRVGIPPPHRPSPQRRSLVPVS